MSTDEIIKKYPYLYETHLHTSAASACARATPEEMAVACKEYGYTGVIVTDHNWGGNTCIDRNLDWEDFINEYAKGYERMKVMGDKIGLQVFFGMETGFTGTEFLVYGPYKDWYISHPEMFDADVEEQYRLVHEAGGLVIHAHPFREEDYIPQIRLFPEYIDGVEGVNATHVSRKSLYHKHAAYDVKAREYAKKYGLPMTGGSDIHNTVIFGGGIRSSCKLNDINDFISLIRSGRDYVLWDGEKAYDPM